MSDLAIRIENLSKRYRIGGPQRRYKTIRETLMETLTAPLRQLAGGRAASKATVWALRNVSLEIVQGEVLGIIGRNGAGKSTLLKILSRITEPTEGAVYINGRVGSLLEVGTGFHPELTGRENIYLNGAILGMRRAEIERKFDEIVDFAGVELFVDTPTKHYSSGMQVRLAFSVAAHLEPEILVVDEVLAVGDASFQKKCLGKMGDVSKSGRTVLFVSHNMGIVRALCSRCILLTEGQATMDGDPSQVISHYLSTAFEDEHEGEICWSADGDAPGGDEIRLRGVRLLDPEGRARDTFDVEQPIEVEVAYQVRQPLQGMRFVLHLLTQEGIVAFASTDHAQRADVLLPGPYRTICTIPSRLLNRGRYIVRLNAGIPGVKVLVPVREYLSFVVSGAAQHGSYYPESWPGVVAPALAWKTMPEDMHRTHRHD